MLITVLMPCLNEEAALGAVLDEIPRRELHEAGYDLEVIVVDGGSGDRSREIAGSKGARVLSSARGYGRQYRLGFEQASGDIIVTADSDGSYPVGQMLSFVRALERGPWQFISISRFGRLPFGAMPVANICGNLLLTGMTNALFRLGIADSQSGMWVFRREALEHLSLTSAGMAFSEEIKIEAFTKLAACELEAEYRTRIGRPKLRRLRDGARNAAFLVTKRLQGRAGREE